MKIMEIVLAFKLALVHIGSKNLDVAIKYTL